MGWVMVNMYKISPSAVVNPEVVCMCVKTNLKANDKFSKPLLFSTNENENGMEMMRFL